MPKVDAELYFTIDEKTNQVELTDKGIETLSKKMKTKTFLYSLILAVKLQKSKIKARTKRRGALKENSSKTSASRESAYIP